MNRKLPPPTGMQDKLRALLARCDSVAALCRAVGINRQQFNKYLAGNHEPSARTLARLAAHFDLSVDDFALGQAEFLARLAPAGANAPAPSGHFAQLAELARTSASELKPFLGTYHRYHCSSIYPGLIVRAVTTLFRHEDRVEYLTVERFPMPEGEGAGHYSFFYSGMCYMLGNRIFMVDYERRQRNELTMAILMPQHRTPIRFLYGLLTGVASSTFRQPFSSRVILERRSDDTSIRRSKLRQATVLKPGDADIAPTVSRYFEGGDGNLLFGQE